MTYRVAPPARGVVVRKTVQTKPKMAAIRRLKAVSIRLKTEPRRVATTERMQEDRFAQAEQLYKFWEISFQRAFDMPYEPKSRPGDLASLDDILDDIPNVPKIEKMIHLLLTHADLQWVGQKNLAWLARARNRTFIAPLMVQRKRTAEFNGSRTLTQKITFR